MDSRQQTIPRFKNVSGRFIELRKIEANLKAIEKWNGILPEVTGAGAIPFIGVGDVIGKN